jgi:hypothetical protein
VREEDDDDDLKHQYCRRIPVALQLIVLQQHTLTATCIIIAPKRLKLRLSGSARKSHKTVSRHAEVQISGRFGSNSAVFITQRRETGRPIPIQMQKKGQLLCNSQHTLRTRIETEFRSAIACDYCRCGCRGMDRGKFLAAWPGASQRLFCAINDAKNDHFAKTGSGQTWEKVETRRVSRGGGSIARASLHANASLLGELCH